MDKCCGHEWHFEEIVKILVFFHGDDSCEWIISESIDRENLIEEEEKKYEESEGWRKEVFSSSYDEFIVIDILDDVETCEDSRQENDRNTERNIREHSSLIWIPEGFESMPSTIPYRYCISCEKIRFFDMETRTSEKCCYSNTDKKRNADSIEKKEYFIGFLSEKIPYLFSILEWDTFDDEEEKNREPDEECTTEWSRVEKWEYREECTTKSHERSEGDFVSFSDGIEHFCFFCFWLREKNREGLSSLDIEHEYESCTDEWDDEPEILLEF